MPTSSNAVAASLDASGTSQNASGTSQDAREASLDTSGASLGEASEFSEVVLAALGGGFLDGLEGDGV